MGVEYREEPCKSALNRGRGMAFNWSLHPYMGCAHVSATFSMPTPDPQVWRKTEPATPPPAQRLRAVSRLVEAGVEVGVALAPILPGLSDRPEQLAAVVRPAREARAVHLWANVLYLKPGTREHFLSSLARDWPE